MFSVSASTKAMIYFRFEIYNKTLIKIVGAARYGAEPQNEKSCLASMPVMFSFFVGAGLDVFFSLKLEQSNLFLCSKFLTCHVNLNVFNFLMNPSLINVLLELHICDF